MKEIEGTKDCYQHLLSLLKSIIKDWIHDNWEYYEINELVDNEIDKCLKDYGVDWKLDEEGK